METRYYEKEVIQLRAESLENGEKSISGYALLFNSPSDVLFDKNLRKAYTEIIDPASLDNFESKAEDVVFVFNHDENSILARTTSGTLQLRKDEIGVFFTASLPNTERANDLHELVKRGDLSGASFAFTMDPKDMVWTRKQEGLPEGRITNIRKIFDVSVVVRPAYPETSVWSRSKIASDSFDIYSNEEIEIPDSGIEKRNRDLQLLKLKIK